MMLEHLASTVLLLASMTSASASESCKHIAGQFSGSFEPAFPTSGSRSKLQVSISQGRVSVMFGDTPEVGFESMPSACSASVISGRFEDNWGNTGKYVLRLGRSPSIELTDLGTPEQIERNTIGEYPEGRVELHLSK